MSLVKIDSDFCIAAGTYGRMVSESNPKVAYWFHEYSGFKYLGKLLETYLAAGDQVDATTGDVTDRDSVTEIIALFSILLLSISRSKDQEHSKDEALRILEIASSGLGRNRDIITVVFDIFEEELQRQSGYSGSEVPLDLLVSCVQFMYSLTIITPTLVWPLIGRSGLLDNNRGSGKLPSIVGGIELVSGRYDLLISCARLYEALVEDFAVIAVARRSRAKAATRFNSGEAPGTAVPDPVLSKVILSFTRYLLDVLESSCTWKFLELDDCRRLRKIITGTFDKILYYTYGLNDTSHDDSDTVARVPPPRKFKLKVSLVKQLQPKSSTPKMMAALELAALHITDSFLSTSSGTLRIQPLLRAYFDGFDTTSDSIYYVNESQLCVAQVKAVLSFSRTLLRVSTLLGKTTSQLESQLFNASPLLARLFAVNDAYHVSVLGMLEALVTSASTNTTEPPSLVGYLGPWTSMNFLHILSDIDKPLSRNENFVAIMQFVSKVVSGRQQW
jgi:nuclear pore complex protein Nup188